VIVEARRAAATAAGILAAALALGAPPGGGPCGGIGPCAGSAAALPAGSTAAVLSLVDAASGVVEVTRHWPGAPADVAVAPYVPYFWDGCPGPGAIMMLITGPPTANPAAKVAAALEAASREVPIPGALATVIASLRTPGSADAEALKTAAPWVSDLAEYERDGYAVFLFIRWTGAWCSVSVQAVPEGYGIPFVR
jgi:hypothetical protein